MNECVSLLNAPVFWMNVLMDVKKVSIIFCRTGTKQNATFNKFLFFEGSSSVWKDLVQFITATLFYSFLRHARSSLFCSNFMLDILWNCRLLIKDFYLFAIKMIDYFKHHEILHHLLFSSVADWERLSPSQNFLEAVKNGLQKLSLLILSKNISFIYRNICLLPFTKH